MELKTGLATGFGLGLFLIQPPSTSSSSSSSELPATSGGKLTAASEWRVKAAVALGVALIAVPMKSLGGAAILSTYASRQGRALRRRRR
jgi:hypothetical protein